MKRHLPPLNSLRAFESAARHLSFTDASEELSVTPAAISQQVKVLENYFEVKLFQRLTRALVLTDSGRMILPILTEGFGKLEEASTALREQQAENIITVSIAPAMGVWLLPRLGRFRQYAPQYDIRIDASERDVDFVRESLDMALRFGSGDYKNLVSECLFNDKIVVVCSPDLITEEKPLRSLADIPHHTLLHNSWRLDEKAQIDWRTWLTSMGGTLEDERGPRFNLDAMVVQAAIAGQGLALINESLVAGELATGRLVKPFSELEQGGRVSSALCYYLVYPEERQDNPKVVIFRDWLFTELDEI
uniref:LysR family transcriptional regulator n=1 Tax=uncultured Thiotrichaceae bacterium TaxID=298394 RepID=A0A6S6TZ53_9GAMM|nr:MAG: LysR family transcriptional regulator [uncultured Thiotrichaceae bacterium]